jgi:regulator of replication initiation timing
MAAHIDANFGTEEELQAALASLGMETDPVEAPKPEETPAPDAKTEPEVPGVDPAEAGENAAGTEPAPKDTQGETHEERERKAKGGFKAKLDKLTAQAETLRAEIEEKNGNESRLRAELEDVKARLAELKPPEAAKPAAEPVKPKRPTLASFEFDQEKYEEALDKYDSDLTAFHKAVADQAIAAGLEAERQRQADREQAAEAERHFKEFTDRRDADRANYDDYDEVLSLVPKDESDSLMSVSEPARAYIQRKSKHPADLIHYLATDYVYGDKEENQRLTSLDPMDQIIELKALEDRLVAERTKGKTTPKAEAAPPAKPKPAQRTPEPPIDPVGGRTAGTVGNLEKQAQDAADRGDSKEYRRIRDLQRNQKQERQVAGVIR